MGVAKADTCRLRTPVCVGLGGWLGCDGVCVCDGVRKGEGQLTPSHPMDINPPHPYGAGYMCTHQPKPLPCWCCSSAVSSWKCVAKSARHPGSLSRMYSEMAQAKPKPSKVEVPLMGAHMCVSVFHWARKGGEGRRVFCMLRGVEEEGRVMNERCVCTQPQHDGKQARKQARETSMTHRPSSSMMRRELGVAVCVFMCM